MNKVINGSEVTVHYVGTLTDGTEFDNSYKRGVPLTFQIGKSQIIPGFEQSVLNREVKEKFNVTIPKDQAYGDYSEANIQEIPKDRLGLPGDVPMGSQIQGTTEDGNTFLCVLKEIKGDTAFLDLNHPLSGKNLNFSIEIIGIK